MLGRWRRIQPTEQQQILAIHSTCLLMRPISIELLCFCFWSKQMRHKHKTSPSLSTRCLPIVHLEKEPRRGQVQLVAHDLPQLVDQFIVIGCSQTTELLQKRHVDVYVWLGHAGLWLLLLGVKWRLAASRSVASVHVHVRNEHSLPVCLESVLLVRVVDLSAVLVMRTMRRSKGTLTEQGHNRSQVNSRTAIYMHNIYQIYLRSSSIAISAPWAKRKCGANEAAWGWEGVRRRAIWLNGCALDGFWEFRWSCASGFGFELFSIWKLEEFDYSTASAVCLCLCRHLWRPQNVNSMTVVNVVNINLIERVAK